MDYLIALFVLILLIGLWTAVKDGNMPALFVTGVVIIGGAGYVLYGWSIKTDTSAPGFRAEQAMLENFQKINEQKRTQVSQLSLRQQAQMLADAYPWEYSQINRTAAPIQRYEQGPFAGRGEKYWDYEATMASDTHGVPDAPLVNYVYAMWTGWVSSRHELVHLMANKWKRDGVPSEAAIKQLHAWMDACRSESWYGRARLRPRHACNRLEAALK